MCLVYVMDYHSNSTWGYYSGLTRALLVTGRPFNRCRQQLAPPSKKLTKCNPVRARYLRHRPVWPRRFCDDSQFFFPAPAPAPFNRRDHLNGRHRAMPIVTISIVLRACSAEKQGSPQKTLTKAIHDVHAVLQRGGIVEVRRLC